MTFPEFVNRLALHGESVMIDNITVPEARFPGLTEAALRNRPSTLYNFYQDAFNINVVGTEERLRELIGLAPGTPLLEGASSIRIIKCPSKCASRT